MADNRTSELDGLLDSGRLRREAQGCKSEADLARKLGISPVAYGKRKWRWSQRHKRPFPTLAELQREFDDEPTNPQAKRWACLEAFDREETGLDQADGGAATEAAAAGQPSVTVVAERITQVEEHRLKRRVRELEARLNETTQALSDASQLNEFVAEVRAKQDEVKPSILPRERTSGLREGTPLILASDWHIEEEVLPEAVQGRNRYNLAIATQRMERFFEAGRWAIGHQREVFKIRDLICWWGGDFITNFLHPDNDETNLLHPPDALLMAEKNIIAGIDYWLEDPEIEQYLFPCNDGNHSRRTKKMQSATRTRNSWEVFLYAQLAFHYRNEPRVKFVLPASSFLYLDNIYGRTIRCTHGDTFKYGGGVGGIMVPLLRALAGWQTVKHADLTIMGNWHQRICMPGVMVNGSLIGYNTFAQDIGARFEPPVQSLRMLEPHRWCSTDVPLWVSDRADDVANLEAA